MRHALLGRAAAVQHCGRRLRQTPAREARDDLGSFDGATRDLSWGELQDLANAAAHTLAARGVGRGDRVAVVLPPTPETAAVFFGVWKLGAILLSMSVLYGDDAIAHRLSDSEACLLVTDAANAMRFDRDAFVLDEQTLADAPTDFVCADTSADDPAQLYYTSGTTGLARASCMPTATSWLTRSSCTATRSGTRTFPRHGRMGVGRGYRASAGAVAARRRPVRVPAPSP